MLDKYPRRDVAYIATASGVTLVDRREPRVVDLDSLGAHIWLRIDGVSSLGNIAGSIAERYNQSPEKMRAAVEPTAPLPSVTPGLAAEPTPLPYHVSMPRDQLDRDEMTRSMREAGWIQ